MPTNKRVQFTAAIAAPPSVVFQVMLDPESYKDWTTSFAEGSHYQGSWEQGQKIRFLAPSGDGMVSEIVEHRVNEFTSIRHLGYIANGVEDTDSETVRQWAPAYENYTFVPTPEGTRVIVDQDVSQEWEQYLMEAWPKALQRLKNLCEANHAA